MATRRSPPEPVDASILQTRVVSLAAEHRVIGHLPVVSLAAEHLVMGHLLRRNILTYKAPPGNEGYDLICIHPEPKRPHNRVVRVQVKSRYQTDCDRGFPVKERTIPAFDFLVVAFLNIGKFYGKHDGSTGAKEPEFYTLPAAFIRKHHNSRSSWEKVMLRGLEAKIERYKNDQGFEQIAAAVRVARPIRAQIERAGG
jgi:hypothetical protein